MPVPMAVAKFNRAVVNPVARRFAGRIAPFAIVEHRGRKSGTDYRTPVMVFPSGDRFLFALTYGPETDWVRNVLAEGGCSVEYRKQRITLTDPRLSVGLPEGAALPGLVRSVLSALGVNDFLTLRA